jgi:trans-aconitate 2-methyltransferase
VQKELLTMPWNPEQYLRFEAERALPFSDLLALIPVRPGLRVVDLGCGTGELTRRLADALPDSAVLGLDSSPEMLARAADQVRPGLRFEQARIEDVIAGGDTWDVVFSHAAIQWVPDHAHLVPALLGLVAPGGRLAVQQPSNHTHTTHRLIGQLAGEEPFRSALGGWRREFPVLDPAAYADLLWAAGGRELTVFEKIYPHVLDDSDALAEWTRGTALVPYLERLPADLQAAFLDRYRAELRAAYPQRPVFYGFRRILFAATRPANI